MSDIIIAAVISGIVSVTGSVLALVGVIKTSNKRAEEAQLERDHAISADILKVKEDVKDSLAKVQKDYSESLNAVYMSVNELKASHQQSAAEVAFHIAELEKKQDRHNAVIERTFKLEELTAVQTEQIKVANRRIADLERHEEERR